jgi:integrase
VRVMSYVRLRGKTGIYEYRRVVPPRLRSVIASVEGFDSRPGRTEFTKSLDTQAKGEANRRGAIIDQKVQAALDDAESRLAIPSAWGRISTKTSEAAEIIAVDPRAAHAAIDLWRRHEIDMAAQAAFNGQPCCSAGDEHLSVPDFRYNLQQYAAYPAANEAVRSKLTGFDTVLVAALARHGIVLGEAHPAISSLRAAFAEAWNDLLLAKDKIASGLWEYVQDNSDSPAAPASSSGTIPATQATGRTVANSGGTPFLALMADWKKQASLKPRQLAIYASDLSAFAAFHPGLTVEVIKRSHAQKWIESLTDLEPVTIHRKLATMRTYWAYIRAKALDEDDERKPFNGLVIPKAKDAIDDERLGEKRRLPFTAEQVVVLWQAANHQGDAEVADAIRLAAFTGARIESLYQLRREHMSIEPESKIDYLHFADKTESGNRHVPIHPAILPFMLKRRAEAKPTGFLLASNAENQYSVRSDPCGKRFGRLKATLQFNGKDTFHSLRKTVATLLEAASIEETISAQILGHKINTMTYGLYGGKVSLARKLEAISKALRFPSHEFMDG